MELRLDERSYAPGGQPWLPAINSLWVVNHIGSVSSATRWRFDFDQAEAETAASRECMVQVYLQPREPPSSAETQGELLRAADSEDAVGAADTERRPTSAYQTSCGLSQAA